MKFLMISCLPKSIITNQAQTTNQVNSTNKIDKAPEGKTLQKLPSQTKKIKLPLIKDFGVFNVFRISDNHDSNGRMISPFKSAEVKMILDNEAKATQKVTLIPLRVDIKPFQLKILKVIKKENSGCNEPKKDFYFDVELEKITDKIVLETQPIKNRVAELPFDVFGIYPSVDFANNLTQPDLKQEMLPKGVAIQTVEAAIDLDNDDKPDLLFVSFCCDDETKVESTDCDYVCQKSFKKINRNWKLVISANPC